MPPLILLGAVLGGAAVYFYDPDKGRRRRALVRDQAVKATTSVRDVASQGARDLRNRGTALTGRMRSVITRRQPTDTVLVERVRAKMGRYTAHPGAIDITASSGQVTVAGSILAHEHHELIEAVSQVPGVTDIVDQLQVFERAEGISELQGSGKAHRGERAEVLQDNWAPGTRLVTGAAGTTLTLYSLARSNRFAGFVTFLTGVALLARAATNKPLRTLAGMDGYKGVDIQKTLHINAPVEQVFLFLANYDNFPRFMRNVLSVETQPSGISHWKVAGPAGTTVEWDSTTTRLERNQLIEWSTVAGSAVEHAGSIRVEPFGAGTRVHVRMSYNPPAGALGHVVAKLFGADPKSEMDQDLMRLKNALETGKLPRDAAEERQNPENVVTS